MTKLYDDLYRNVSTISICKPLILNVTNSVTQDFIANSLLALGANPIMSEHLVEIDELVTIADAININVGTLHPEFNQLALYTAQKARHENKCIILDPVGAGATKARTALSRELLTYATIIRGNASEIIALRSEDHHTQGVEAKDSSENAISVVQKLTPDSNKIIVISGATDFIYAPPAVFKNVFGSQLMQRVTGMGCVLSSVVAAFAAVNSNYAQASYLAVLFYTLCGEQVAKTYTKPGSFKVAFIDALYAPDWDYIQQRLDLLGESYAN